MSGYRKALRYSEEACQLEPENGDLLSTLGVAYYRVGNYEKALDVLARSDKINALRYKGSHPLDLAFLAMAHQQLGHAKEAEAAASAPAGADEGSALGAERRGSGLPARSGRIAGKTQAAEQQVNKCGRPEEECKPVRVGSVRARAMRRRSRDRSVAVLEQMPAGGAFRGVVTRHA